MQRNHLAVTVFLGMCVLGYAASVDAAVAVFTDLNPKVIFNTGDSPPVPGFSTGDLPNGPFDITNNTGLTWTDFHIDLVPTQGSAGSFGFIDFAAGGYDGMGYEGPGTGAFSDSFQTLDIVGLNVPNGGVLSFTVDVDHFEFFGTLDLVAYPTVSTEPPNGGVPEPMSMLVWTGLGLVAGCVTWWRRSRCPQ